GSKRRWGRAARQAAEASMGASIPQVSRRVHRRACQFGKILNRCGTETRSRWLTQRQGSMGLCQGPGDLSIGVRVYGVDEFGWSEALFHCPFTKLAPDS